MKKLQKWQWEEIREAYEDGVPEAIPKMKEYEKEWQWHEIRWAYINEVPEAIHEMVKHEEECKWKEIRVAYRDKKFKKKKKEKENFPDFDPNLTLKQFINQLNK